MPSCRLLNDDKTEICPCVKNTLKMDEKVSFSCAKIIRIQIDKSGPFMYDKDVEDRGASFKSNGS